MPCRKAAMFSKRAVCLPAIAGLLALGLVGCALLPQDRQLGCGEGDKVVLTISNEQPFSGREGDPRPNWLGWGASAFAIAPDGSIWIADTAVQPNRLLHFDTAGILQQTLPLEQTVLGLSDLVVTQDAIWLLALASQPAQLHRLGLDGSLQLSRDIPEAMMTQDSGYVSNGIFTLWVGEDGALLSSGVNGLHRLLDPSGQVAAEPLKALSYYGHSYGTALNPDGSRMDLVMDGASIAFEAPAYVTNESLLGFNPDGSLAVAVNKYDPNDPAASLEQLVHYYAADGTRLGVARLWPNFIQPMFNQDLAFGPDGQVYQLVSNPDHSVQVVCLGFAEEAPPPALTTPTVKPTALSALLPAGSLPPDASDEEQARQALLRFFALLAEGRYAEGGALFSGDYAATPYGPPGDDLGAWWQTACGSMACLPPAAISAGEQTGFDEYTFYVEFLSPEGGVYQYGPCCGGNPAETPPVWQFAYPVKKIDGEWQVMRTPLWLP